MSTEDTTIGEVILPLQEYFLKQAPITGQPTTTARAPGSGPVPGTAVVSNAPPSAFWVPLSYQNMAGKGGQLQISISFSG